MTFVTVLSRTDQYFGLLIFAADIGLSQIGNGQRCGPKSHDLDSSQTPLTDLMT